MKILKNNYWGIYLCIFSFSIFACFFEPKKSVWVNPEIRGNTVTFGGLPDSARKFRKFKRERYYVLEIRLREDDLDAPKQGVGLVWHRSLLPYQISSPHSVDWDFLQMTVLPERITYGQHIDWLKERVPPETLKPGYLYFFEMTILGMDHDEENMIHFWIRSYFEVDQEITQ